MPLWTVHTLRRGRRSAQVEVACDYRSVSTAVEVSYNRNPHTGNRDQPDMAGLPRDSGHKGTVGKSVSPWEIRLPERTCNLDSAQRLSHGPGGAAPTQGKQKT